MGKGLRRWLFERQNLNEVVVQAKMVAATLEYRVASLIIHKFVVLQTDGFRLVWCVVKQASKKTICSVRIKHPCRDGILELDHEGIDAIHEELFRLLHLLLERFDRLSAREHLPAGGLRPAEQCKKAFFEGLAGLPALIDYR